MINKKREFKNIVIDKIIKSELDIRQDIKDDGYSNNSKGSKSDKMTKPTLFENKRKLQNKVPEGLVTLLKVNYPFKEIMTINKVIFFLYFVIMVRNSQNFSPCLNS